LYGYLTDVKYRLVTFHVIQLKGLLFAGLFVRVDILLCRYDFMRLHFKKHIFFMLKGNRTIDPLTDENRQFIFNKDRFISEEFSLTEVVGDVSGFY